MKRSSLIVAVLAVAMATPLAAADPNNAEEEATIKWVEMTTEQVHLDSGAEMYQAFCAACHGTEGKGNGPASAALATPCPDLTRLAEANSGDFPAVPTLNSILRDREITAHGTQGMPVWGDIFRLTTNSPANARHRGWMLMKYVESLQIPAQSKEPVRPG